MKTNIEVSLVVPSFNEEGNIKLLFSRINEVFSSISYEVIFVDDGSKDDTFNEIKKLSKIYKNIKAISFSRNFGKDAAIYAGLEKTTGKYTCVIDADMQQDPSFALEMINILKGNKNVDCVCAVPKHRNENKIISFIKNSFYYIINKISDIKFERNASDFRAFNSDFKKAILEIKEKKRFSKGIFSWVGFNVETIEYEVNPRISGETKWSFIKLFKYAINGIVSFSFFPLKLSLYIGFIVFIIGIILLIIQLINPFSISVNGLFIIIMIIFVFQFFAIGIIGLYLSDMHIEVKKRPIYIIKEEIK